MGSDGRFLSNRNVRSASRQHEDFTLGGNHGLLLDDYGPGLSVIVGPLIYGGKAPGQGLVHPGGQHRGVPLQQRADNGLHLFGPLSLAVDHLGAAGPEAPVVVDPGEAQVFEGQAPQRLSGLLGAQVASGHRLEHFQQPLSVQS